MLIATVYNIKLVVAMLAAGLAPNVDRIETAGGKTARRVVMALLVVMAVLATLGYFDYGRLRYGIYMNPHDVYHYYIGSKYSKELGYYNLYRCSLIADAEGKHVYNKPTIRNLENHRFERVSSVFAKREEYKKPFSPDRWREFKKDIEYFRSRVPASKWNNMLRDKGYNATPVWNMVARFITNRCPTDNIYSMRTLVAFDIMLIALMLGMVLGAFGARVLLFTIIFFGTNFFMSFVHIRGAFLRLDWVTMLVMTICLIKADRYKTAGAFMSYAAMARIFPAVFLFGMGGRAAWTFFRTRRVERKYIEFFATFAICAVALVGLSILADGGIQYWTDFFKKISIHNAEISTTRVGFKYIFLRMYGSVTATTFNQHKVMWWAIQAFVLFVSFFAVRKLDDYESVAFGFVPAFFLVSPTFYYYVMLIVPLFLFAPKLDRATRSFGLALMFLVSAAAFVLHFRFPLDLALCFYLSCILLGLATYMLVICLLTETSVERRLAKYANDVSSAIRPWRYKILGCTLILAAVCAGWAAARLMPQRLSARIDNSDNGVELVFVGDVMLSRNVAKNIEQNKKGFTVPFQKTVRFTRAADIAFCNVESPISGRGTRVPQKYTFNAPAAAVDGLAYADFDVVSLACNHILDYGPIALQDTMANLAKKGIKYVGISKVNKPQTPVIIDVKDLRVGYLAYSDPQTPYMHPVLWNAFNEQPVKALKDIIRLDISNLRDKTDVIVVSIHWGIEYDTKHSTRQEDLGHFVIDQGATILAGHHPHVQEEPELYKNGLIIYSMGNFVFDQWSNPLTRQSRLYRVLIDKTGIKKADYIPLEIAKNIWQPRPTGEPPVIIK